jgi:hypothetical protein
VQTVGKYKGNETLFEDKALTAAKPQVANGLDYNATLARVFANANTAPTALDPLAAAVPPGPGGVIAPMGSIPLIPTVSVVPTTPGAKMPKGALPGDIPADIPLAGGSCKGSTAMSESLHDLTLCTRQSLQSLQHCTSRS